jgi:two-component system LytT family response regulator
MLPELRILLVDDEPLVRAHERDFLAAQPAVSIVGEAGDGPAAIEAIERLKPAVVLLDVQMPGCDGFEVLEQLDPADRPTVVFVTAWQEYALRAFEAHAVDYLLKPFDEQRLLAAVERARVWCAAKNRTSDAVPGLLATIAGQRRRDRFVVRQVGRVRVVPTSEVEWIEARGNYVHLHHAGGPSLVRANISDLAVSLDPERFVRVHRSAMVALAAVDDLRRLPSGATELRLASGAAVPLGRSYREAFSRLWAKD